jgi:hypothetical protein
VQGRPPAEMPEQPPSSEVWEAAPIMKSSGVTWLLIPPNCAHAWVLRWGNANELSGFRSVGRR